MDLVRALIDDPDSQINNLKEIRTQMLTQGTQSHVLSGNLKKLILALKHCLNPNPMLFASQKEMTVGETLKIVEQLIYKNDPDLEIHFFLILPSIFNLLDNPSDSVSAHAMLCLKLYCQMTQNVEQVLQCALRNGVENDNAHVRHEVIRALPEFVQYGVNRQIERSIEFRKMIDVLLIRARGDNTDSIRSQAQESLREVISHFSEAIVDIMPKLTQHQQGQLRELIDVQQEVTQQQVQAVSTFSDIQFDPVPMTIPNTNVVAYGCLPMSLVQHIQGHSDWKMKLKAVEDLEKFLGEMSSQQKQALLNYASSFITFVEESLIDDDHMKIVLTGIRILKFIMKNAQMAEKTNMTRLIHSMIMKLNDPKPVVRTEIESFFQQLSYNMKTRSLILTLLQPFKTFRITNEAKQSILRIITMTLLIQNGSALNDLQHYIPQQEDNLAMQLVEPVSYLYASTEEPILTRYYAQETLAIFACLLDRTSILETMYECLSDDKTLYDQFCDRLDAQLVPFLSMMNGVQKLEYPLPQTHVFSVKYVHGASTQMDSSLPLHPRRLISDQKKQEEIGEDGPQMSFQSEFNDYFSDQNEEIRSQKSVPVFRYQDSVNQPKKVMGDQRSMDNVVQDRYQQPSQTKITRRPLGGAGLDIIANHGKVTPPNFKVELPTNPTSSQISEKLRFLKARQQGKASQASAYNESAVAPSRNEEQALQANRQVTNKSQQVSSTVFQQVGKLRLNKQGEKSMMEEVIQSPQLKPTYKVNLREELENLGKNQDRVSSPPFYSAQVSDINHDTLQMYTNKLQYQAVSPLVGLQSIKQKPSYYSKFMGTNVSPSPPQNNTLKNAQMVQTSIPNMANSIKKAPLFDAENQVDEDKMTVNSDFSRGSNLSLKSKKLENLQKSVKAGDDINLSHHSVSIAKDEDLTPLDNPSKSMNLALLDLQKNSNWEKQLESCNVLRQALKFNPEKFTPQGIQTATQQLLKLAESLRSLLSKAAIQTLQEFFTVLGPQMDSHVESSINVILKKCTDTNVFLSESSRLAIEDMCLHCNEQKLLLALLPQASHKSPIIKSQIARCLEQVVKQMGQKLIYASQKQDQVQNDKVLTTLASYINDSSPEVRFNARNAILSMEHGQNPVGSRVEIERFVKRVIPKKFDQDKILQIFEEGIERQKSLQASLNSFVSLAKSSMRQNSQYQFAAEDLEGGGGSPNKRMPGKSSPIKKPVLNNSKVAVLDQSPSLKYQYSEQMMDSQYGEEQEPEEEEPPLPRKVQEQIQKELTSTLQVLLKQNNDQKGKFALLNFAEAALKQKSLLLQSPLFFQALNQVILSQLLQTPTPQQLVSSKAASMNLVEAEILYNLLSDVHTSITPEQISQVLKSVSPYLGSTNNQAKKNAENLITKISMVYQARDISQSLADSALASGLKGKIFLIDKLTNLIPQLNDDLIVASPRSKRGSPQKPNNQASMKFFSEIIFPAVYRLLDEYMAGRGKNLPPDLKSSIDRLIKAVYDQHGSALIEKSPSNKLSKILDIVNKEKKLQQQAAEQEALNPRKPSKTENTNPNNEMMQHQLYLKKMEEAEKNAEMGGDDDEQEKLRSERLKEQEFELKSQKSGVRQSVQKSGFVEQKLASLKSGEQVRQSKVGSIKNGEEGKKAEEPFEVMEAKQEVARASFKSLNIKEIVEEKEPASPFK